MGGFNKILSFVLGLIVVVVFLAVLSTRFNLTHTIIPLRDTAKITPSPTPGEQQNFFASLFGSKSTPTPTSQSTNGSVSSPTATPYVSQTVTAFSGNTVTQIPKTGSETELLPIFIATLASGLYLCKRS